MRLKKTFCLLSVLILILSLFTLSAFAVTKAEVDAKILEAGHLTRKTFKTLEEANNFATSVSNPEAYIYMVASTPNTNIQHIYYLY